MGDLKLNMKFTKTPEALAKEFVEWCGGEMPEGDELQDLLLEWVDENLECLFEVELVEVR